MNIYEFQSHRFGFRISLPEGWRSSRKEFLSRLSENVRILGNPSQRLYYDRTFLGPEGKYLHILITPSLENEPEPTINETEAYFDDLSYRQNLHVINTGSIKVLNKDHFWATYYRMSLIGNKQTEFFKKYCLYLNNAEYLLTALLYLANSDIKPPTDQMLKVQETIYDGIITSFENLD